MPILVDWYDESKNIILRKYLETWTLQDIKASFALLIQLAKETSERFDIISDFSQANQELPPIGLMWQWYESDTELENTFPNWHLNIYIASSNVGQAYFEESYKQYDVIRKHSRQARTLTEGLQIIMTDRAQSE